MNMCKSSNIFFHNFKINLEQNLLTCLDSGRDNLWSPLFALHKNLSNSTKWKVTVKGMFNGPNQIFICNS